MGKPNLDNNFFFNQTPKKFDASYYTPKNLVSDGIADEVLAPGEGIKKLIEISSQRDSTQGKLLEVIIDADKRKKKGKNPAQKGNIDGTFYANPRKYLEATVKKYEEIHDNVLSEDLAKENQSIKERIAIKEKWEEATSTWNTSELEKLFQETKIKYQGWFSDEMFDTTSIKYYTLLHSGKLYGRFKNRYRNPDIDKYLEDQLTKQWYNKENLTQIINSKLYNDYIQEFTHKWISNNTMKKAIDNTLKNSHEGIEKENIHNKSMHLSELKKERKLRDDLYRMNSGDKESKNFINDDAKKSLTLWLFKNIKGITYHTEKHLKNFTPASTTTDTVHKIPEVALWAENRKDIFLKQETDTIKREIIKAEANDSIDSLDRDMDNLLAKENRTDWEKEQANDIIIGLKLAGFIGKEWEAKLIKLNNKMYEENNK